MQKSASRVVTFSLCSALLAATATMSTVSLADTRPANYSETASTEEAFGFVSGAIVGGLIGWSSGYGYPRAHHQRYGHHHRPYYAPRRHHRPHYYGGHSRRHYSYSDGAYNDRHSYRHTNNRACHPVYKHGYWHGRPAKVGGTMCYNRYGNGYVVSGSRYLIHYR